MKTFIKFFPAIAFLIFLQSCMVSTKPNMSFFDSANSSFADAKFTSINVPMFMAKPFIKKALREDGEDSEQIVALVKKVKKIKVLTVENGNPEMLKEFSKSLDKKNYQDWATITQDGQKISIKALQPNENLIKKLMLTVHDGKDFVFVDVKGNFTTEDISSLINNVQKSDLAKNKDSISQK